MNKSDISFAALRGQGQLKRRLCGTELQNRCHTLLFLGPKGSGRRSAARALAKKMLCENPSMDDSCGVCDSCRFMNLAYHPDFREIDRGDDKLIKIERVRRELITELQTLPQRSRYKIFLVEADGLSEQGQNALLKSLEEPPPHLRFFLTAEHRRQLLPTLISRSAILKMVPLPREEMLAILQERVPDCVNPAFLAAYAGGIPGRALELSQNESFAEFRDEAIRRFYALFRKKRSELLLDDFRFLLENKEQSGVLLELWQGMLRDAILVISGEAREALINREQYEKLRNSFCSEGRGGSDPRTIQAGVAALAKAEAILRDTRRAMQINASHESLCTALLLQLRSALHAAVAPDAGRLVEER